MVLANDTRGWIMTCISGIACVCGAGIICVDLVIRRIPRYRNFEIASSDTFLSASLSLSFGVMLFSALYNMLPSAKDYLISGTFSPKAASYALIGLFLSGVIGIQLLSRAMHHFIPTHVVDCDHTHGDEEVFVSEEDVEHEHLHHDPESLRDKSRPVVNLTEAGHDEETPLLARSHSASSLSGRHLSAPEHTVQGPPSANGCVTAPSSRRPSVLPRTLTNTLSKIASAKLPCDEARPCKGFSDPCGQDCFKSATRRGSEMSSGVSCRNPTLHRAPATLIDPSTTLHVPEAGEVRQGTVTHLTRSKTALSGRHTLHGSRCAVHHFHHPTSQQADHVKLDDPQLESDGSIQLDGRAEHHHHVPTNAFLSIGLQTSLAIALHKAPEGFITYATNHANPSLGFAVFMALFIHNITEGFAMALPLYLALQSRTKAIIWSSFLGGLSQPLGAGVAAIWFKVAKGSNGVGKPSEDVYGCMFAITAGVMASVALQLFSESLGLSHNKNICIGSAFLGMSILGVSSALTA